MGGRAVDRLVRREVFPDGESRSRSPSRGGLPRAGRQRHELEVVAMSGFFDWLFGSPSSSSSPSHAASSGPSRVQYCSGWLDPSGKVRDQVCGLTLDDAFCREKRLLDDKKLGIADRHDVFDHEASVERRYLKGRGKHSKGAKSGYAARVALRRRIATEDGDPCRRRTR